jgi:hypothetical protein
MKSTQRNKTTATQQNKTTMPTTTRQHSPNNSNPRRECTYQGYNIKKTKGRSHNSRVYAGGHFLKLNLPVSSATINLLPLTSATI